MALLEIRDLSKSFGGIRAVDGCSFAVAEGSITALIGPNGAGKTTVFNLISGLHRPDSGAILFDGARIDGLPPHRITGKGVARTFQISRDLAGLSVLENMVVQSPAGGLRHLLQPSMSPAAYWRPRSTVFNHVSVPSKHARQMAYVTSRLYADES